MARILLGVSGGIAAYKALELVRRGRDRGLAFRCVMTAGAREFVTPLSLATLSGDKVYTDLFSLTDEAEIGHIRLARDASLVVVAPATANLLARMANGHADDLATTVLLATDKPVLVAPAMNPFMWGHPATKRNVARLKKDGVRFVEPVAGELACKTVGTGKLEDVENIVAQALALLTAARSRWSKRKRRWGWEKRSRRRIHFIRPAMNRCWLFPANSSLHQRSGSQIWSRPAIS